MKKYTLILAATVLTLTGCNPSEEASQPTPSTSNALPSSSTTTSTTISSSDTSSSVTSTSDQAPTPEPTTHGDALPEEGTPMAEPTVVECLEGTPGPALWSDGTVSYSQWCFDTRGGEQVLENERQAGLENPGECVGPAAECGYGTAENGARNPSSGEIQTYHGCQDGYIDDPDLCAAVEDVIRAADPDGTTYY